MNMFDEARAMSGTLLLCKITQRELAERLGVSQSYVANKLRLLSLSPELEKTITENGISERHARTILSLEGEEARREVLNKVISRKLTVRECEALVDIKRTEHAARRIEGKGRGDGIDSFYRAIREGVEMLSSIGVEARARTSHEGGKMYITVCICDT